MNIRFVSWNIAGGHKAKSLDQFAYESANLQYFAEKINALNPNIICIQEFESDNENTQINLFSEMIKSKNFYFVPSHKSHITNGAKMGNVILSNQEITNRNTFSLPPPEWELKWPDGRIVEKFDKKVLTARVCGINIANLQLEPIGLWGENYYSEKGKVYGSKIDEFLVGIGSPSVVCGDFSGDFFNDNPSEILKRFFRNNYLEEALPNKITRPTKSGGSRTDHIFYNKKLKLIESGVVETKADHYLCYADF